MKRILFVDDESKILDGIRRMMRAERKRWDMHFALGGEAALQACEAGHFDVVVSDMRMPGMDGATLLGHIRDRYPCAARIVLSGYADAVLTTRAARVAHRFLTKPSNASEIQSEIERVFAVQDLMASPEIRAVVGSIDELPSLSRTYVALTEGVTEPNVSVGRIAEIVEKDIAMAAKILQLVNSAFFGLAQRVVSLRNALSCLGMETIRNLALASETFRVFEPHPGIPGDFYETLQTNARLTAAIAAALPVDPAIRDVTVVAALLHDVGRLILASKMPDQFRSILALARERQCPIVAAEREIVGTSHAEIGAYLLGLWGIPNLAVEAIAYHHNPTGIPHVGFDSSVAVYVANLLADELATDANDTQREELGAADRAFLETLGLLDRLSEFRELARRTCN